MDRTVPELANLFAQLGLANHPQAIVQFICQHRISANIHITQASFWNEAQRHFLQEAHEQDAQWTEIIDQLDAQLRD